LIMALDVAIHRGEPLAVLRTILYQRRDEIQKANGSGEYPLHAAASAGFPDDVLQLLYEAWPDAIRRPAGTARNLPLHLAAASCRAPAEGVTFLADRHPQALLHRNCYGRLPLHCAVFNRAAIDVVKALVELAPEAVSRVEDCGLTPVRVAVRTHQLDVVRYLVDRHPKSLHERLADGRGLLHDAVATGAPAALVKVLVGCAPEAVESGDGYGKLPLHFVGSQTSLESVRLLAEASPASVRAVTKSGRTPLHTAIINEAQLDVVKFLVEHSGDASLLGIADRDGCLPMHYAAKRGSLELVKILVEAFPTSIRAPDARGRRPIHVAVAGPWSLREIVEYLSAPWPESLHARDSDGNLPLHAAVAHAVPMETVRFLAEQHPEAIEHANDRGDVPLHIAVANFTPSFEIAVFLAKKSPQSVRFRGSQGRLPLHLALEKETGAAIEISCVLIDLWPASARVRDDDGRLPLHAALTRDDPSHWLVRLLLELYPDAIRVQDSDGRPPWHAALHRDVPPRGIVPLLVEQCPGALLVQDAGGKTLLHFALGKGHLPFESVQALVHHEPGALQLADHRGFLPLHVALASQRTSTLAYATCLVEACPESLQVEDHAGRTPLAVAIASAAPLDVVHFLLAAWPPALELLVRVDQ
jgi:ankyrin repeat protein